jgi:hypothetical protein
MEELNIDNKSTNEALDQSKYNDICPKCKMNRFWLKYYNGKTIKYCQDCGFFKIL